jgi:hypothetical protein
MATAGESAAQVLAEMSDAYASLQTYSDTGVVFRHFKNDAAPNETTFETAFARPKLFRFAWVSHHPYPPLRHVEWKSVIWFDGRAPYSHADWGPDQGKSKIEDSLTMAVAGATGVSGGAAHTVVRLILPEIGGFSLGDLASPELVGVEVVEGVSCDHVLGTAEYAGQIDLWVGRADHMLRKQRVVLAGVAQEEIRRNIQLNQTIPLEKFSLAGS